MTLVEAVLAMSTLYSMYRTSRSAAVEAEDAAEIAALDACDLTALDPLADPVTLPPVVSDGEGIPMTFIAPEASTWFGGASMPDDAVFNDTILATPTVEQQVWTSPTAGRFIVTIGTVGDTKQITVQPDASLALA